MVIYSIHYMTINPKLTSALGSHGIPLAPLSIPSGLPRLPLVFRIQEFKIREVKIREVKIREAKIRGAKIREAKIREPRSQNLGTGKSKYRKIRNL